MSIVITKSGKAALDGIGFLVGEFTEGETLETGAVLTVKGERPYTVALTDEHAAQLVELGVAVPVIEPRELAKGGKLEDALTDEGHAAIQAKLNAVSDEDKAKLAEVAAELAEAVAKEKAADPVTENKAIEPAVENKALRPVKHTKAKK